MQLSPRQVSLRLELSVIYQRLSTINLSSAIYSGFSRHHGQATSSWQQERCYKTIKIATHRHRVTTKNIEFSFQVSYLSTTWKYQLSDIKDTYLPFYLLSTPCRLDNFVQDHPWYNLAVIWWSDATPIILIWKLFRPLNPLMMRLQVGSRKISEMRKVFDSGRGLVSNDSRMTSQWLSPVLIKLFWTWLCSKLSSLPVSLPSFSLSISLLFCLVTWNLYFGQFHEIFRIW